MITIILNILFFRNFRFIKAKKRFLDNLGSELAEEFLQLLLNLMSLMFFLNKDFRRNIRDFNARYLFKSKDSQITITAIFKKNKMKVYEKEIDKTNVTVIFKDSKALMKFLLSPKPDILNSILKQEVTFDGNLNYLYKFIYMSRRLQSIVTGKA
jgi:hypothetical protein